MTERVVISDPLIIALLLGFYAIMVLSGRIEIMLGIYCSVMFWVYIVDIGESSFLWISVGALLGAAGVHYLRYRLLKGQTGLFTQKDIGLIIWAGCWVIWILLSYTLNPTDYASSLYKNSLLYSWLPFSLILAFIVDIAMLKRLVSAFVVTTVIVGVVALQDVSEPVLIALEDPTFQLRGVTGVNYLSFAVPFAISIVFSLAIAFSHKRRIFALLAVGVAGLCVGFITLTGARQSQAGAAVAVAILIAWSIKRRMVPAWLIVVVGVLVGMVVVVLFNFAAISTRWSLASDALLVREVFWGYGVQKFFDSPILGSGLDYGGNLLTAHNLALDALAGQGVVGFGFLIGFAVFTLRAMRGSWSGKENVEIGIWRMMLLASWVGTVVQTQFSGSVTGSWHFFWTSALIWRAGAMARQSEPQPLLAVHRTIKTTQIEPSQLL